MALRNLLLVCTLLVSASSLPAHGDLNVQLERQAAALVKNPKDVEARFLYAQTLRYHEEWDKSAAQYAEVLRQKPEHAWVHYGLGCLAVDRGKPAEAEAPLKEFLKRQPKEPKALALLAEVYQKLGRKEEAVQAFKQANRAEPRVELYLEEAQVYSSDGRLGKALAVLESGIKTLGPLVVLQKEAIALERSLGRTDAALKRVDLLMKSGGRMDGWLELRGDVLAEGKRLPQAKKAWKQSLDELAKLPEQRRLTQAGQDQRKRLEEKLAKDGL